MTRPLRLAGHDAAGEPIWDTDVLDAEELAIDAGWIDAPTRPAPIDPALVDEVVQLQGGAA